MPPNPMLEPRGFYNSNSRLQPTAMPNGCCGVAKRRAADGLQSAAVPMINIQSVHSP
jgi:hypothetical protein